MNAPSSNTEPPVCCVLYLQLTVWISQASRRWRQNEGLAVKGMPPDTTTVSSVRSLPRSVRVPPETGGADRTAPLRLRLLAATHASPDSPDFELYKRIFTHGRDRCPIKVKYLSNITQRARVRRFGLAVLKCRSQGAINLHPPKVGGVVEVLGEQAPCYGLMAPVKRVPRALRPLCAGKTR